MATKLRLQRHGKKAKAYFHIVAADSRAKRDGKFIEKVGVYNPNTNPATIDINFERALYWVKNGAEPTDTTRAILSYKGVLYKDHLDRGVAKGAHTQAQADAKFDKWLQEKEAKIEGKASGLAKAAADNAKKRMAAEKEYSENRAASIAAKNSELTEAIAAEEAESVTEEAPVAEAPATEESSEEKAAE